MFSHKSQITFTEIAQLESQLGLLLGKCNNLVIDSRKINSGDIFCAYPGTLNDGRDYIANAVAKNALAILWEPGIKFEYRVENYPLKNLMHNVGILASIKAGYPSRSFFNIAVTGTNGKTSISHWLNQAYTILGKKSAIIGTTGAGIYPNVSDFASTTPDPITLQRLMSDFKQNQVDVLAMEVSSHGLDQGRVNGVNFNSAIFTNLTQDHLDYHKTMENYFQAKAKLFYWDSLENAIINVDDEYGRRLYQELKLENRKLNLVGYGINNGDLKAENICLTNNGMDFDVVYQGKKVPIHANIVGRFNVYNLLSVIASLITTNVNLEEISEIINRLNPVAGRMDAAIIPGKPLVVVDYSHTPDSLQKGLETLLEIRGEGRLICVFGCGGNRDSSKRPIMGAIASEIADVAIVTTDNPRYEDPQSIINEIVAGIKEPNYKVIIDRKEAILFAIRNAKPEDIVMVAGKGHEDYQEIKGVKFHFSDLEIVRELLNDYPAI